METIYKTYPFTVKEIADRTLEFVGSTEDIDRDGEVVEVAGWQLDNYMKNPVFMWAHDYREPPIGKAIKVWKRDGQLKFNIEFAPKETYEFADTIYKLYKGGFLNATSVGFMPDLDSIIQEDGDGVKTPRKRYKKQELLELSGVPIPSNVNALRNAIDSGVITIKEFQAITKPEETEQYIRIPVDSGNHEGHRIRTIDISAKEGIKAIYCGTDKVIMTYLFAKDKGWTMDKARAWIKEHGKKALGVIQEVSQEEIIDEIDYLTTLIKENGMSGAVKKFAVEFAQNIFVQLKEEVPVGNAEIIFNIGAKALGYDCIEHWCIGKDGERIKGYDLRISGSDIPVKDIKETITNQDIQEAIKRIAKT